MPLDPNPGTEAWGRCPSCDRWFYCGRSDSAGELAACPVCAAPPAQLDHRLVEASR